MGRRDLFGLVAVISKGGGVFGRSPVLDIGDAAAHIVRRLVQIERLERICRSRDHRELLVHQVASARVMDEEKRGLLPSKIVQSLAETT